MAINHPDVNLDDIFSDLRVFSGIVHAAATALLADEFTAQALSVALEHVHNKLEDTVELLEKVCVLVS